MAFPLPPPWYKLYDSEKSPYTPPPLPQETYVSFGKTLVAHPVQQSFSDFHRQQLFASDAPKDRATELKRLNKMLLATSLELIQAMILSNPEQTNASDIPAAPTPVVPQPVGAAPIPTSIPGPSPPSPGSPLAQQEALCTSLVERVGLILLNMHHLINLFRPAEARRGLVDLMEVQYARNAALIRAMRSELARAGAVMRGATSFSAQALEIIRQADPANTQQAPPASTADGDAAAQAQPPAGSDQQTAPEQPPAQGTQTQLGET
ncbi:putative MED7 protein [Paratrimastix pyriformis]|uniref:Mediator of RNA polymerase II transcription subunit 7 n=1 Tax=Paratrimastix pyriformis TaxID=342808 RepID=A0ABQ8UIY9_9EUKA|nr:putative MED7 protein [Paratrimastix pyriformis]